MATQFGDEARSRLAPLMTPDLAKYIDALGEMFKEVEEYAREDDRVLLGPLTKPLTAAAAAPFSSATDPWRIINGEGTRGDDVWDTSVTIDAAPTMRIDNYNLDTDPLGYRYDNAKIDGDNRYVWRGAFIGTPGKLFIAHANTYDEIDAGGASSGNGFGFIAGTGVTEFELEFDAPPGRNYAWLYFWAEEHPAPFWLSSHSALYRVSKASAPVLPWAKITNPEAALNEAALIFLAQLAGVRVPQGLAYRDMQSFIERAEARRRGRLDYMVDLAKSTLTGTKTVVTMERVTSAWTLRILTRTAETPDPAATEAAILRGKPAGIVLDYEDVDGITWDEAVSDWNETALTWEESGTTVP